MIVAIVAGLVVIAVLAVVWLRLRAARSDRRSMETYGHALGVLGDVARRTGPSPSVRVLPRGETGGAHVRTGVGDSAPRSSPTGPDLSGNSLPEAHRLRGAGAGTGAASPARAYRRPSVSIPVPGTQTGLEDRGGEGAGARRPALRVSGERVASRDRPRREPGDAGSSDRELRARAGHDRFREASIRARRPEREDAAEPGPVLSPAAEAGTAEPEIVARAAAHRVSPDELRRQATVRRLATGACAAVAVTAIVLAAVLLSGSAHPTQKASSKTRHHLSPSTSVTSTTAVPSTTARPAVIEPISSSGTDVSFQAPAGHYVLTFATSGGPCWAGVETGVGTGDFLWEETVQPGSDATYKASGSLVVDVGAAEYLSLSVNGVPARIPHAVTTGYILFVSH